MSLKQLKSKMPFASDFVRAIEPLLERGLPDRFFDSFEYNETGNNLCHPRTVGLLDKAAWSLPADTAVEIDVHLNVGGGVKFQPDLTVRDHRDRLFLIVDFENPNSSDARIVQRMWATTRTGPVPSVLSRSGISSSHLCRAARLTLGKLATIIEKRAARFSRIHFAIGFATIEKI